MKKRILGLALALVMIISLLPLTAFADATVKKVDLMVGTNYAIALEAADDGSKITYTKNKEVDMNDGTVNFKGWAQEIVTVTNEATDEWNTKFYYDAEASKWTLVLKGAKLDAYNNDTSTAVAGSYLVSASQQGNSAYSLKLNVVVQEDSYLEGVTNFRSNCAGASGKWSGLTITSNGDAKLHMTFTSYGTYTQCNINVNANLVMNGGSTGTALYMNKGEGILTFEGGNSTINAKRLCGGENRFLKLEGGNVTATLTDKVCSTAFTADHVTVDQALCYTLKDAAGADLDPNGISGLKSVIFASHTHTPTEAVDDGDCSTPVVYSCGKEAVPAKQHIAGANADDCTKDTMCGNPGCTKVFEAKKGDAHVAGQDDGDCTTDILCSNPGCTQVAAEGAAKHVWDRTSCDVAGTCTNPNCTKTIEAGTHTGGTATCKDKAKCDECGKEYGELGACKPAADDGDCTTDIKCSVCGKTTTAGATAHKYTDKNDTTCDNAGCTNTRKVEGTENPKTGDNSAFVVMAALMVTAAAAFVTTKKFAR